MHDIQNRPNTVDMKRLQQDRNCFPVVGGVQRDNLCSLRRPDSGGQTDIGVREKQDVRNNILYIHEFNTWTPEQRTCLVLAKYSLPGKEPQTHCMEVCGLEMLCCSRNWAVHHCTILLHSLRNMWDCKILTKNQTLTLTKTWRVKEWPSQIPDFNPTEMGA